ncbi:histidine kinase N-terminal 7TM domain-containing diguanylate cyclase [Jeongeupia chitinilytica]|uniref:diguanylate cyclase n=1 Tax=Jeongeupia chitinilytica TaxID=1041641 RepID=A0ABQ3H2P6_9NEIS|nr:histidine kinase N-terminal 7TM domain-containing protein [Jeongeupia chitinilytica]GHD65683.1 GGDEF domain-containing protein [Jeongeupia chitinilytica]
MSSAWLWQAPSFMLLSGSMLMLLLALWISLRPAFAGRAAFVGMQLTLAWWCGMAALEYATTWPELKADLARWTWPAIVLGPTFWLLFALRYLYGHGAPLGWRGHALAWSMPLLIGVLAVTDSLHHGLYRSYMPIRAGVDSQLHYFAGPVFYFGALYLYLLMLGALTLMLLSLSRCARVYRKQYLGFVLASLPPWIANVGYITQTWTLFDFDPTPFALTFTCLIFAWLIRHGQLFDLIPVARTLLLDALPDPVLVLDRRRRIVEANPAARRWLGDEPVGRPLDDWHWLAEGLAMHERDVLHHDDHAFEISRQPLGTPARSAGELVLLRDVSHRIRTEQTLSSAMIVLEAQLEANQQLQEQLHEAAIRDPLTGSYNRRFLAEIAPRELSHAARTGQPLALALIDFDHFKRLNDSDGHAAGDAALVAFARGWQSHGRADDYCFRYGGEEWLLLLSGCNAAQAAERVDALRQAFAREPIGTQRRTLTFSAGIAVFPADGGDLAGLTAAADAALYHAKATGRNRVVTAAAPPTTCNETDA